MPRGIPSIITNHNRNKDRRKELGQALPGAEILGHINPDSKLHRQQKPEDTVTTWTRKDGTEITLTEPPPPWETGDADGRSESDARRFVEVPPNWKLYWVNPKYLGSSGWRDWQAVMASDPRVKVRVSTMQTPEGYIRRGGPQGDILAWMWDGWYASVKKRRQAETDSLAESARTKQQQLQEEFARGTYGPNLRVEAMHHPTHTNADGRTMAD